ncbi:MAG: hypothetical protein ABSD56_05525 [Bryobacteraceae bacterium]
MKGTIHTLYIISLATSLLLLIAGLLVMATPLGTDISRGLDSRSDGMIRIHVRHSTLSSVTFPSRSGGMIQIDIQDDFVSGKVLAVMGAAAGLILAAICVPLARRSPRARNLTSALILVSGLIVLAAAYFALRSRYTALAPEEDQLVIQAIASQLREELLLRSIQAGQVRLSFLAVAPAVLLLTAAPLLRRLRNA